MSIINVMRHLRAQARRWLPKGGSAARARWGLAAAMLVPSLVHAGFVNGGFETGDFTGWTIKSYERTALLAQVPPRNIADLKLGEVANNGFTQVLTGSASAPTAVPNAPTIGYPRWGSYLARVNNVGNKTPSRQASSIEQTALMTQADVDPIDHKVHVRFGMAPVLFNPSGHDPNDQPFFYVEVVNVNKNGSDKTLFSTFNYANQPGAPWQGTVGGYLWTDWSAFDIAPGEGLLDPGDTVRIIVFASNCYAGGNTHEARVYLDSVGAFMAGLTVAATGPSTTKPDESITYTYNYANNSGVYAADAKVRVALPITEDNKVTTYVSTNGSCTGPHAGTAPRQNYLECDVGSLNNGQTGSFEVTYLVPATAVTSGPNAVLNNGDYSISATDVSAFQGPMVKTNIVGSSATMTDLAVTISNGGVVSYLPNDPVNYTVTVENKSGATVQGNVAWTLKGVGVCTDIDISALPGGAACSDATGDPVITFSTNSLAAGGNEVFTVTVVAQTAGTPINAVVSVTPNGATDSDTSNNTAGANTPVNAAQQAVTANTGGTGLGHILSVPAALACGDASTPCDATGTTKQVGVGDQVRLTPVAHPGSIFTGWTTDPGYCTTVEPAGNVCVVDVVNSVDVIATASFALAHIVTPTVTGGTSVPPLQVPHGGTGTFTLTPTVPNSVPQIDTGSTTCAGVLTGPDGSGNYAYTVTSVNADCAFTVSFVPPDVRPTNDVTNTRPETSVAISVLDNDRGDRPLGTVTTTGPAPAKGGVSCTTAGICTYTPNAGQTGTDTFSYQVCLIAPNAATCKTATVTVNISSAGVVATNDVTNTPQGQPKTIPVLQNDTTAGGGAIDPASVAPTSTPSNGAVVCSPTTGECVYTPNGGFTGTDQFTYRVCLAAPNQTVCDDALVTVAVTPTGGGVGGVTSTATANNDLVSTVPGVPVNVPVTANDTATGGAINPVSVVAVSGPANGAVDCTTTPGVCRYIPSPGFVGVDSFTYRVCLAAPSAAVCDEAVVRVQVAASTAAIPTLSEWGLIILSALMGLFTVGMRRRRMF